MSQYGHWGRWQKSGGNGSSWHQQWQQPATTSQQWRKQQQQQQRREEVQQVLEEMRAVQGAIITDSKPTLPSDASASAAPIGASPPKASVSPAQAERSSANHQIARLIQGIRKLQEIDKGGEMLVLQDRLEELRARAKGVGPVQQAEHLYMVSKTAVGVPAGQ